MLTTHLGRARLEVQPGHGINGDTQDSGDLAHLKFINEAMALRSDTAREFRSPRTGTQV